MGLSPGHLLESVYTPYGIIPQSPQYWESLLMKVNTLKQKAHVFTWMNIKNQNQTQFNKSSSLKSNTYLYIYIERAILGVK